MAETVSNLNETWFSESFFFLGAIQLGVTTILIPLISIVFPSGDERRPSVRFQREMFFELTHFGPLSLSGLLMIISLQIVGSFAQFIAWPAFVFLYLVLFAWMVANYIQTIDALILTKQIFFSTRFGELHRKFIATGPWLWEIERSLAQGFLYQLGDDGPGMVGHNFPKQFELSFIGNRNDDLTLARKYLAKTSVLHDINLRKLYRHMAKASRLLKQNGKGQEERITIAYRVFFIGQRLHGPSAEEGIKLLVADKAQTEAISSAFRGVDKAFVFKPQQDRMTAANVIKSLVEDCIATLGTQPSIEYEHKVNDVVEAIDFIIQLGAAGGSQGPVGRRNLTLELGNSFSKSLAQDYIQQLRALATPTVKHALQNEYSDNWSTLVSSGYGLWTRVRKNGPSDLSKLVFDYFGALIYDHVAEWSRLAARSSGVEPSVPICRELPPGQQAFHLELVKDAVAAWERLRVFLFSEVELAPTDADLISITKDFFEASLEHAVRHAALGDFKGAAWWIDSYLRALGYIRYDLADDEFSRGATGVFLTFSNETTFLALKHFWSDIAVCVLLESLAEALVSVRGLTEGQDPQTLINVKFAQALLNGSFQDSTGSSRDIGAPLKTVKDVGGTILRILASGEDLDEGSYHGMIDRFLYRLSSRRMDMPISGRIYSIGHRVRDFASVTHSMVTIILCLAPKGDDPLAFLADNWRETVIDFAGHEAEGHISRYLERMLKSLTAEHEFKDQDQKTLRRLIEALTDSQFENEAAFQNHLDRLISCLRNLTEERAQSRQTEILEAPIDPERLTELERYAANDTFDQKTTTFPFNHIDKIDVGVNGIFTDKQTSTLQIRIEKDAFCIGGLAQPVSNEKEWFQHVISDYVEIQVVNRLITEGVEETIKQSDPYSVWNIVSSAAANMTTPILVIPRQGAEWLNNWLWQTKPSEMKAPENFGNLRHGGSSVNFHIGRLTNESGPTIEVYMADLPFGQVAIIDGAKFMSLEFFAFSNGLPIEVKAVDGSDEVSPDGEVRFVIESRIAFEIRLLSRSGVIVQTVYPDSA